MASDLKYWLISQIIFKVIIVKESEYSVFFSKADWSWNLLYSPHTLHSYNADLSTINASSAPPRHGAAKGNSKSLALSYIIAVTNIIIQNLNVTLVSSSNSIHCQTQNTVHLFLTREKWERSIHSHNKIGWSKLLKILFKLFYLKDLMLLVHIIFNSDWLHIKHGNIMLCCPI